VNSRHHAWRRCFVDLLTKVLVCCYSVSNAFAQILKELCDNAVDACAQTATEQKNKRVRVAIERFEDTRKSNADDDSDEILRVTVSDNGCGMENIQACVGVFHTSKAHNAVVARRRDENTTTTSGTAAGRKEAAAEQSSSDSTAAQLQTAGRYGIGLTLSLLHAQRLVPNSCASIRSATAEQREWTRVLAVVDADHDSVRCILHHDDKDEAGRENESPKKIPKEFPEESGTSISILVPVRTLEYRIANKKGRKLRVSMNEGIIHRV
jgi:DNA topoisomerase VI subunit B